MIQKIQDTVQKMHSKKGLTFAQIIGIVSVILIAVIIALYLAAKKPAAVQEITNPQPIIHEPPAAKIISNYDREYDTNEYCADNEIYNVACEETCDPTRNGRELKPQTALVDCKAPKRCCQYPPEEWPSFDEELK